MNSKKALEFAKKNLSEIGFVILEFEFILLEKTFEEFHQQNFSEKFKGVSEFSQY